MHAHILKRYMSARLLLSRVAEVSGDRSSRTFTLGRKWRGEKRTIWGQFISARPPQVLNGRIYPLLCEQKACRISAEAGWTRCCAWQPEIRVNKWCAWSEAGSAIVFGHRDELATWSRSYNFFSSFFFFYPSPNSTMSWSDNSCWKRYVLSLNCGGVFIFLVLLSGQ